MKFLIDVGEKKCLFSSKHQTCKLQNFKLVIDHDKVACDGSLHGRPSWCVLESVVNENEHNTLAASK